MNKDNINNYVKIIGNIFLDLNIWKGISARTQFGLDYGNAYNRAVDGVWSETGGRNSDGENYVGSYQSHPLSYVWTNTLSYTLSTGKHNLDVVLGTEATRFVQEGFSARREGIYLEDRDFAHIGVTTGEKYNLGSSADEYTYFSLFGKANYVYNGKYLLSATVRRDGSSLFGENNRYATFPASPPVGESRMKLLWKILTSCPTLSCVPAGERTEVCKAFREGILPLRLRQIILEHLIPFRVMRAVPCIPVIAGPGLVILT